MSALSEAEYAAYMASSAAVRQRAAAGVRRADTPAVALQWVSHLHRALDQVAASAAATGPVPVCRAGCAYCCRVRVEVTVPEVLPIVMHLRTLAPAQQTERMRRLQQRASRPSGEEDDCGFLDAGHCSIYALRPAACRKAHSLALTPCETRAPHIPQHLGLVLQAEALMHGVAQGFEDAGLSAATLELNAAVLEAMHTCGAEQQWFAGRRGVPALDADAPGG
jgi:hypothetical protein